MPTTCADQYTADEITAMRAWLDDACHQALANEGLEADDLSDEDVVNTFLDFLYDA
jgi:hypothetical protein